VFLGRLIPYAQSRADFNRLYSLLKATAEMMDARFDRLDRIMERSCADIHRAISMLERRRSRAERRRRRYRVNST
jgi:hypothetical protein